MRLASAFSPIARDIALQSQMYTAPVAPRPEEVATPATRRASPEHRSIQRRDTAQLSPQALELSSLLSEAPGPVEQEARSQAPQQTEAGVSEDALAGALAEATGEEGLGAASDEAGPASARELSPDEQKELRELQARDREVRAHEQAHKAAAGQLATGGPSYDYESGPDGRDYAVGGEVGIRLSEGNSPEESLRLAQQAQRAALAPAEPSGQDHGVAAQAAQLEASARAEMKEAVAQQEDSVASNSTPAAQAAAGAQAARSQQASAVEQAMRVPANDSRISAYLEVARSVTAPSSRA